MNILLTGGTGMLGRALCQRLLAQGHRLTVLSRQPEKVRTRCGQAVQAIGGLEEWLAEHTFDAIINLAGATIFDLPWTEARKRTLWQSRITLTEKLLEAIQRAHNKPSVLLSASAIGYYGDCGEASCSDALAEPNPSAHDFGARLCAAWERAALGAESHGVRVCLLRTGLVMSASGGLLPRMRLPFRFGLGARIGDGMQWMSWIHIDDFVSAALHLLQQQDANGAWNLTAPHPVRNAEFTNTLAASLNKAACLTLPTFAVRLMLGQRAYLLLGGQRVLPERLLGSGFKFQYPTLATALQSLS